MCSKASIVHPPLGAPPRRNADRLSRRLSIVCATRFAAPRKPMSSGRATSQEIGRTPANSCCFSLGLLLSWPKAILCTAAAIAHTTRVNQIPIAECAETSAHYPPRVRSLAASGRRHCARGSVLHGRHPKPCTRAVIWLWPQDCGRRTRMCGPHCELSLIPCALACYRLNTEKLGLSPGG